MDQKTRAATQMRPNADSKVPPSEDFEPHSAWETDEAHAKLVLHLPDFKKDQLRVQINNQGILRISGERPHRFVKEITVPHDCIAKEVRAKFSQGYLQIIMPKKVTPPPSPEEAADGFPPPPSQQAPEDNATQMMSQDDQAAKEEPPSDDGIGGAGGAAFGQQSSVSRLSIGIKRAAIRIAGAVAVAAGLALGVYFTYKYLHG